MLNPSPSADSSQDQEQDNAPISGVNASNQPTTSGTGVPPRTQQDRQTTSASDDVEPPPWAQQLLDLLRAQGTRQTTSLNEAAPEAAPESDQLAQQLATEQQRARDAMLDLAVYRAAAKHQADPDALLDSTSFRARVQALDPAASDFTSKLGEAIKKAVEDNPRYRAGTTPARSGAHITNGPPPSGRPKSLADAVRASYGT